MNHVCSTRGRMLRIKHLHVFCCLQRATTTTITTTITTTTTATTTTTTTTTTTITATTTTTTTKRSRRGWQGAPYLQRRHRRGAGFETVGFRERNVRGGLPAQSDSGVLCLFLPTKLFFFCIPRGPGWVRSSCCTFCLL